MTNAQHRAAIDVDVPRPEGPGLKGAAPHGMWWVAWRQHRLQAAVLLVIVAAAAAALIALRFRIVAVYSEFGCELFPAEQFGPGCVDADGVSVWWNYGFSSWSSFAQLGMLLGPVVLGAFAAAPVFTREFSRGTHVLALTQSVSRKSWFIAKTTVMVVPLTAGLLALGIIMQWTQGVVSITAYGALGKGPFFVSSIIPAAIGLAVFALTIALGMISRSLLPALVVSILVGAAMLFGLAFVQPHVLPADRTVTTMAEQFPVVTQSMIDAENAAAQTTHVVAPVDPDQAYVGNGYLNADGDSIDVPNRTMSACFDEANKSGDAAARAAGLSDGSGSDGSVVVSGGGVAAHAVNADSAAFYNSPQYRTAYNESMRGCFENAGVAAQYHDSLPGSMLWPLRWAMTGICVILAALFLGVSAWRLKPAIAKR